MTDPTDPTRLVLPTGQSPTYGLYPNTLFHRGEPAGQRGTVLIGGRRLPAVHSGETRVWCPAGDSGDWFAVSSSSRDTFVVITGAVPR